MTLYRKTILALGVTIFALILILYGTLSSILLKSYADLETQDVIKNTERFRDAYLEELLTLDRTVSDWAQWDRPFNFIAEKSKKPEDSEFVVTELMDETVINLKINIIAFFDSQGRIYFAKALDLDKELKIPTPESFMKLANEGNFFRRLITLEDNQTGLLMLPEGPMIFASRAVFPTNREGSSNGMIVMGRFLSSDVIHNIAQRTHLNTTDYRIDDPKLPEDFIIQSKILNEKVPIVTQPLNDNIISGYLMLNDVVSNPALLVRVDIDRDIFHQGKKSINYIILTVLVSGLIFGVLILFIIGRIVLFRVRRLGVEVNDVKMTADLSRRVTTGGSDELSLLSSEINEMLVNIETAHEKEKQMMAQLKKEQEKSEELLLNILPSAIVNRLKINNETIADHFAEATVLFADIVGFTQFADTMPPAELVALLNTIFSSFDQLTHDLGLEKIKTIGDSYMLVGGLPEPRPDHAQTVVRMALEMLFFLEKFNRENNLNLALRIGIHSGPVVAGVIGTKKFIYDLWGDTVNLASRMESHGIINRVQISPSTYEKVKDDFECEQRGLISVKGKGEVMTYIVNSIKRKIAA